MKNIHINRSLFTLLAFIAMALGTTFLTHCKKFEVKRKVILSTDMVADVGQTSCVVSGTLLDLKDQVYPGYGFHWARSMNEILPGDTVNLGRISNTREFTLTIRRFEPGTRYFIWTYVRDESGETRAEALEFTTLPAEAPVVETRAVTVTGPTTAECAYSIPSDGGSPLTQRGLCWGTAPSPSVDGLHTEEGSGKGDYTGTMTGLVPGTDYYVRAYAVNNAGTSYGNTQTFATPRAGDIPTVVTNPVEAITFNSAQVSGSISSDGGLTITEKGICWSTEPTPTIENQVFISGGGAEPFEYTMTGLAPDSHYFVRAFAANDAGVGYGEEKEFFTLTEPLVDTRDNNRSYQTVRIGQQVWMAQNLDIGTMINGSLNASDNGSIEKYCFQNKTSNCAQFGGLYSWEELMQYNYAEGSQGVCPDGWHIPSDAEWKTLEETLGMTATDRDATDWRGSDEGGKLKVTGIGFWDSPNEGATNESGFSALPAGGVDNTGYFSGQGFFTDYWTSTWDGTNPWYRLLDADHAGIQRLQGVKDFGTSVRCIKD